MKTGNDRWHEVRRWIDSARESVEKGFKPDPAEKSRILKDRAKKLAQEPEKKQATEDCIRVIEFMLAHERYALETLYVKEVYPLKDLTPVPGTPGFVLGITNVRGHIISVLDIKKFFGLPERGLTDLNKVIILHVGSMEFGILADSITGIRSVPCGGLQASLPTLTDVRKNFLKGVTGERLIVLDALRLLSDKSLIVHEED